MKIVLIVTGIIIFVLVFMIGATRNKLKKVPMVTDHEKIISLTEKNFQYQTKDKVILVDFWAEWCAPCRMMAPVLNDVASELSGNAFVGKVNIEEYPTFAQNYQVRNIPTMILFKNGKEINRFVGIKSKSYLMSQIKKVQ
jgi:thioredoxin 1